MKIGLIAINRVGAFSKDVDAFARTAPGLSNRLKALASMPSLALLTIAAMIPKSHEVKYVEYTDIIGLRTAPPHDRAPGESLSLSDLEDFDLVGISSYTAQIRDAYHLADLYRQKGAKVVLGGSHVSYLPDEALDHCDAVSIGEGESTWPQIVSDMENGSLKPTYGTIFGGFDLKDAPVPAYELANPKVHRRVPVQASRGCPHRCEFCASSILISARYKQKPIEKVLQEIDKIRSIWRRPFIEFVDDNAFVNKRYWKELLPLLAERNIRWFAECDISVVQDLELLELMKLGGCAEILIGLESSSAQHLDGLELNNNWKFKHGQNYKEAVATIQSFGIRVIGCFIIGLDSHDKNVFADIEELIAEIGLYDVQTTLQTAFPGTPLYKRLENDGRLIDPTAWERCTLFDLNFVPAQMTAEELQTGFVSLAQNIFTANQVYARKRQFHSTYTQSDLNESNPDDPEEKVNEHSRESETASIENDLSSSDISSNERRTA